MKKRVICLSVIVIAVIVALISARTVFTSAGQEKVPAPKKVCFEVYVVRGNDTLWTISEKNASRMKMSTRDYVEELKIANGMNSDKILNGGKLILPYGIYE